jgi:hypothetical protein
MRLQSTEIGKLATALAEARKIIKHPTRNKVNPHFRNRYADLTAVLDAVTPAFSEVGLAIVQMIEGTQLVTTLTHSSGEFISTAADIPAHTNAQQLGSALTYLRRYTVQALAAIAADDDDDGAAASPPPKNTRNSTQKGKPAPTPSADELSDF